MPISHFIGQDVTALSHINGIDITTLSAIMGQDLPSGGGVSTSYANPKGSGDRDGLVTVTDVTNNVCGQQEPWTNIFIDGITSGQTDNWLLGGAVSGKILRFDFGSAHVIDEIKYYQGGSDNNGLWQWQGSNTEGSGYTNIGSPAALGGAATVTITALSGNTTAYRYYQMVGSSGSADGSSYGYEFEFKISA